MTTRRNVLMLPAVLAAATVTGRAANAGGNCPPGLAKKSPACLPPGQAKKHGYRGPRVGDRIDRYDYHRIRYPDRYDLPRLRAGERYYVVDGRIYRVDRDSHEILDFIRSVAALLD